MLKELLPTVLNRHFISCVGRVPSLEEELSEVRRERDGVAEECRRVHRQCDRLMADCEAAMKETFAVKVTVMVCVCVRVCIACSGTSL